MAGFVSRMMGWSKPQEQPQVPTKGDARAHLHLLSFGKAPYSKLHSSATPFGTKLEVMLRLAGLPYTAQMGDCRDPVVAPKRKLPVLWHGDNVVPDSDAIVQYLLNTYPEQMAVFTPPDAQSKAKAAMAQRMLEEHTYFCMLYLTWQRDDAWADLGPAVFAPVPGSIRGVIMTLARSSTLRDLHGQGMGRHSLEEVVARMKKDYESCEAMLSSSGGYLSGSTITQADCFLWALLDMCMDAENIFKPEAIPPHAAIVKSMPALMAFYGRLRDKVFPDGASDKWLDGMFDPKKGVAASDSVAGSGAAYATTSTSNA